MFVLIEYYFNFIPYMVNRVSPIIVFITAILITVNMSKHSEITAMLTSGVTFFRFLRPYALAGLLLSGVVFVMVGWIIPMSAKIKVPFEVKYISSEFYFDAVDVHFKINDSIYVYLERYNNRTKKGNKFTIEKIIDGNLLEKLMADEIVWDDQINKWSIKNYTIHTFHKDKHFVWNGNRLDTIPSIYPKDFESKFHFYDMLTIPEITEFIEEYREKNIVTIQRYEHEKYERFLYPFSILIMTIMGVLVSMGKSRGSNSIKIVLGFFLSFVYIVLALVMGSISESGLVSPWLTALLPTSLFLVITLVMLFILKR